MRLSDDNAELTGRETATGTIDGRAGGEHHVVVEGTAAAFVVELSTESRKTVTVSYATADGTALASEDYTAVLATELEFTSGQTAQTISVATTVDGFLDEARRRDVHGEAERSRQRDAEGRRRDGDGDDRRQRRRAGGEHHGSAGGGRSDRGSRSWWS